MKFSILVSAVTLSPLLSTLSSAISISDNPSRDELVDAANQVKENMMSFYGGNQPGGIPGYMMNSDVYYWWQTGGFLGQLINHWAITGNDTYNNLVLDAMKLQSSENDYFMPSNQSKSEGNDDQAFWAFAALDAAETNFPELDNSTERSWLGMAQGVFNSQTSRWRSDICNGGLQWQIYPWNAGGTYKNTPSNGGFFAIAARLARFTANDTYVDWAEKMWDWLEEVTLIEKDTVNATALQVYDGIQDDGCVRSQNRFTYNNGMMILGCAYLYDHTKNQTWADRALAIVEGMSNAYLVKENETDLNNGALTGDHWILSETICEYNDKCNYDQPSFKAYVLRWLTVSTQLVPSLHDNVSKIMAAAVKGAARQCIGQAPGQAKTAAGVSRATPGTGNNWCGQRWWQSTWDGWSGLGEQMSAMSAFQNSIMFLNGGPATGNSSANGTIAGQGGLPLTAATGGTSQSDPNAGADAYILPDRVHPDWKTISAGDRFAASLMTVAGCAIPVAGLWFVIMVKDE